MILEQNGVCLFVFVVLSFELRALHMQEVFYCMSPAPSHFCCGYFGDEVSPFAQASLDQDPPLHFMHSFSVEMESPGIFAQAGLEPRSSQSQ
jgi:hypothetical protein